MHALEYLWKAAYCFHTEGTEEAEAWVLERALALLQGKVSEVAAEMRRSIGLVICSPKATRKVHVGWGDEVRLA